MPTTVTHTIKASGGDYTSLSAWEAAQQRDLVAADEIAQAECYDFALSDLLVILGWTTDATRYIRIFTPLSERHDGRSRDVSGTGFKITGTTQAIRVNEDYVRLEGLDVDQSSTGSNSPLNVVSHAPTAGANQLLIESCIFQTAATTAGQHMLPLSLANLNVVIRNSIAYTETAGIRLIDTRNSASALIEHFTGRNVADFGLLANSTTTVRNTVIVGSATECFWTGGTAPTGSHNASSDTSAGTDFTNSLTSITAADQFVSLTGGSEDFHLKVGSSLEAVGTPIVAVTTDIDGDARNATAPDIGADEMVATMTDSNAAANTVAENAANGSTVGVTGLVTGSGKTVTYSLTDSAGGKFAIHSGTGVVTKDAALDYETATSHDITIRGVGTGLDVSEDFTINVTDVAEGGGGGVYHLISRRRRREGVRQVRKQLRRPQRHK